MISGTIYNAGKMLELTQKWEQKKNSGNIVKRQEKELTPEERQLQNYQEDLERMREGNEYSAIYAKIQSGQDLSPAEEDKLRARDPKLYMEYKADKMEQEAYEKRLKNCRTKEEAQKIVDGDLTWMATCGRGLVTELYSKMKSQGLRPRTIVDYERVPFVYAPGNVRVTLDYNIRTGLNCTDFLNPDCVTIPAGGQEIILEVKWDEYLPSVIRHAVQVKGRKCGAFSKYAACRIYG